MKKAFIFISAVILASCGMPPEEGVTVDERSNGVAVLEIDSCEYIRLWGEAITHKANCKFCKERAK